MAKIAEYLKQILSARYGRDVRQSIHDAISAINDETTECWATVEKVPETLAIAAVKDRVSGKDITLEMSSDFVLTDFKAWGNTEQDSTTGKNLLDCNGLTATTTNGVTFTPVYADNGELEYINVNGTATARTDIHIGFFDTIANTTYTASSGTSGSSSTLALYNTQIGTVYTTKKFTATEDGNNVVTLAVFEGATLSNVKVYPQIEVDTTATPYEPFTNGASPNPDYPQEINSVVLSEIRTCGKNLAKINETDWTVSDNYITNKSSNGGAYLIETLNLKANTTYYIRLLLLSKPTADTTLTSYINDVASIYSFSGLQNYDLNKVYTATYTPTQDETLDYRMWGNSNSDIFNFQFWISTDETDKTYEPYTESVATLSEPITMNGLGDIRDYIDLKRGVKVQNCFIKVFDGTETIASWQPGIGGILFGYEDVNIKYGTENTLSGSFCNYLIEKTNNQTWNTTDLGFSINPSGTRFRFRLAESITTVEQAKAWLAEKYASGNPFTIVVPIAEHIETPLPDADVEALKNIRTFKGITHVFTDSEVQPDMEVEYVIDTKMYIDKKFEEMQ